MSAVLETPHQLTDPTAGLELTTGTEISLEATRHIFLAANLLDPARQRDIDLPGGGEELANVCLRRTRGLLPRCAITPLEVWGEVLPPELFPDGAKPLVLKGMPTEDLGINRQFFTVGKPIYFFPHYPGEMIVDVLGIATGERRGIVEIGVLREVDVDDGEAAKLQALFFGNWLVPTELRLVGERIEQVAESVVDTDVHSAADDMIRSVDQSREYMLSAVDLMNTQLDTRVTFQHTHRLTPKIRNYMAQLEIVPRRQAVGEQVQDKVREVVGTTISAEALEQMAARDAQFVERLGGVLTTAIGDAIKGVLAAAPPAESTEPTKPVQPTKAAK